LRITILLTKRFLALVTLAGLAGCGESRPTERPGAASIVAANHEGEPAHDHNAPHGGHIVDLGSGKFHAELTHDDATRKVGVYVLDSTAAQAAPIDAESIAVNCLVDGRPAQFMLAAAPQPDDPPGTASHFELVSEALCNAWDAPGAGARLNVLIGGKPYTGDVAAHDHAAGHSHSHAGDDSLVWRHEDDEQGYHIALGHHGQTLHAGHAVEPAVGITLAGQPVADARVFNALLDADGKTVLAEEVATVYEPPSSFEPAHYAQGALRLPTAAQRVVIRYRVVLPEGHGEQAFDLPVEVE
jgi:predicted small lipoprotein YifL